jgi:predicted GNAT family N-acyltransferase
LSPSKQQLEQNLAIPVPAVQTHPHRKFTSMNFRIELSDFDSQFSAIRAVRTEVFLVEQKIDPELEFDQHDLTALHVVAYQVTTPTETPMETPLKPIGTGRLDIRQQGRIGRVAVLAPYRRQGVGRQLMLALESAALDHQLPEIWFHSQVSAVPFYQSLGYTTEGEVFLEANIPHLLMRKKLRPNPPEPPTDQR